MTRRRSSSHTSPAPHRRHGVHQPQPTASPAEAPAASTGRPHRQPVRAASFQAPPAHQPFLVSPTPAENMKADVSASAPQLSARPTGKLARRRRQAPDSPTPARAVAVPAPRADGHPRHAMSRSVPETTVNFGGRPAARRTVTSEAASPRAESFPVCDDLSDGEDTAALLFPVTPVRPSRGPLTQFDDSPFAAPLFNVCVPSTPYGGVFDMSSDEDVSSPSDERAQLLFGLMPVSAKSAPASTPRRKVTREQQLKDDFFANSQFQNSPDPDDLPVPPF
jgi:hypothetical protein